VCQSSSLLHGVKVGSLKTRTPRSRTGRDSLHHPRSPAHADRFNRVFDGKLGFVPEVVNERVFACESPISGAGTCGRSLATLRSTAALSSGASDRRMLGSGMISEGHFST
jgi:hypothetical protein